MSQNNAKSEAANRMAIARSQMAKVEDVDKEIRNAIAEEGDQLAVNLPKDEKDLKALMPRMKTQLEAGQLALQLSVTNIKHKVASKMESFLNNELGKLERSREQVLEDCHNSLLFLAQQFAEGKIDEEEYKFRKSRQQILAMDTMSIYSDELLKIANSKFLTDSLKINIANITPPAGNPPPDQQQRKPAHINPTLDRDETSENVKIIRDVF